MLKKLKNIEFRKPRLPNLRNSKIEHETSVILKDITDKVSAKDLNGIGSKLNKFNKSDLNKVWNKVMQLWDVANAPDSNWKDKAAAIGALVYVITTLDAIPDVIPGFGFVDDVAAVMIAIERLGLIDINSYNFEQNKLSFENEPVNLDNVLLQIEVLTSALFHCANADNEFSTIESQEIYKIIDLFVFSDEGLISKKDLERINITKSSILMFIKKTLKNPMSMTEIVDYINDDLIDGESFYMYLYMVAYANGKIHPQERKLLNKFRDEIHLTNQSNIELKIEEYF